MKRQLKLKTVTPSKFLKAMSSVDVSSVNAKINSQMLDTIEVQSLEELVRNAERINVRNRMNGLQQFQIPEQIKYIFFYHVKTKECEPCFQRFHELKELGGCRDIMSVDYFSPPEGMKVKSYRLIEIPCLVNLTNGAKFSGGQCLIELTKMVQVAEAKGSMKEGRDAGKSRTYTVSIRNNKKASRLSYNGEFRRQGKEPPILKKLKPQFEKYGISAHNGTRSGKNNGLSDRVANKWQKSKYDASMLPPLSTSSILKGNSKDSEPTMFQQTHQVEEQEMEGDEDMVEDNDYNSSNNVNTVEQEEPEEEEREHRFAPFPSELKRRKQQSQGSQESDTKSSFLSERYKKGDDNIDPRKRIEALQRSANDPDNFKSYGSRR